MNTPAHLVFDRALLRARLARAHAQGAAGFLVDHVAGDFVDRLSAVLRPFPRILDLGTPTQALATLMAARAPEKLVRAAPVAAALAATAGVTLTVPAGKARGCTTLYYTTSRSPLPGKALWLNAEPNAVISHAVTMTDVAPEYAAGQQLLVATALGDAANLSDDQLDTAARREIAAMAAASGDRAATTLTRLAIWRVPYAQFAQPPGWRDQRPTIACGLPGLWRASEVLHSSSLEGAARGGQMAARAIIQQR
jgi:hypothetical protein